MRVISLFLFLSCTTAVHAQQVYKCMHGIEVAYQSQPCSPDQRTIRQWDATPDAAPVAGPPTTARTPKAPRTSRTRRISGRTTRPKADPADARCLAAKARREAKLKAVGLKRTFDLLRKLDDAVYDACKLS